MKNGKLEVYFVIGSAVLYAYRIECSVINKRGVFNFSPFSAGFEPRFWAAPFSLGAGALSAPLLAGYRYLRDRLSLQWRRWLNE